MVFTILGMNFTNKQLWKHFREMASEDPEFHRHLVEATSGNQIFRRVSYDNEKGMVNRRAPPNPLASPVLGKYRFNGERDKEEDPAKKDSPIRGRLILLFMSSAILLFVFLQALTYNKYKYGNFLVPFKENRMLGPNATVLLELGGLNAERIKKGEGYRIFWAMWMHSGWIHIILNIIAQLQYFFMFEPDWGFWRTLLLFLIGGVTGNVVSATANPCLTTVGSSGALFGLMGGMLPYCIEYWKTIPRPGWSLIFSTCVVVSFLFTEYHPINTYVVSQGGLTGGILFGMGTIATLEEVDPRKKEVPKKEVIQKSQIIRIFQKFCPRCRCGKRELIIRAICWIGLIFVWNHCFTYCILVLSAQISLWIYCFVKIFVRFEYQPIGGIKFTGMQKCCCCWYQEKNVLGAEVLTVGDPYWKCLLCDALPSPPSRMTWKVFCEKNVLTRIPKFSAMSDTMKFQAVQEPIYNRVDHAILSYPSGLGCIPLQIKSNSAYNVTNKNRTEQSGHGVMNGTMKNDLLSGNSRPSNNDFMFSSRSLNFTEIDMNLDNYSLHELEAMGYWNPTRMQDLRISI